LELPSWLPFVSVDFLKLMVVFLLTLPVAYNRESATQIMGLRTFPLVSVSTCGFLLITQSVLGKDAVDAQSRVMQGILAGIGFIGGGAILKGEDKVLGSATAASIWLTGALGIAVAYGRYDIAIFLSLFNILVLRWLTPIKEIIRDNNVENDDVAIMGDPVEDSPKP
jgi:putative Mg2+ transporter-C (MgtC) family protein